MSRTIKVILSSVRPGRTGEAVARWVMETAAAKNSEAEYELIDLKELDLPFMDEPVPPMMAEEYIHDHTKQWSKIVNNTDGFIFVTPEYNHGYPPALKNSLDYLHKEWQGKPAAFVGYGGSGAQDSIRQLREVVDFIGFKSVSSQVGVNQIWAAFDDHGHVKPDNISGDLDALLEEVENFEVGTNADLN